ncbi:MAG: hypothetical protein ACR2NL_02525, partial [Acidimicrobiia bacterium]
LNDGADSFSVDDLMEMVEPFRAIIERRDLPLTLQAEAPDGELARAVLDDLVALGLFSQVDGDDGDRYQLAAGQSGSAAYYRNTIVHFFVNRAITELAVAAVEGVEDEKLDRVIVDEALALRDLLKFEFFFSPSDEFVDEIRNELDEAHSDWRSLARSGEVAAVASSLAPSVTRGVLEPFLRSYLLVSQVLVEAGDQTVDPISLSETALALGADLLEAGQLRTGESVSSVNVDSAIALAKYRNLLETAPDVGRRRQALHSQLEIVVKRIDQLTTVNTSHIPSTTDVGRTT